jgi:hypothetical protein
MLIEAVKDQQKQIDSLSTELTALKESMWFKRGLDY